MKKLSIVSTFLLLSVPHLVSQEDRWLGKDGGQVCAWGGCEEALDSSMLKNPLRRLIAEGLAMLKGKEYAKFFKTFMSPEEYKKLNENGAFEQITAAMASEVGPQLVELFERLKDLKPAIDQTGKSATYTLPGKAINGRNVFRFQRLGKQWYVDDRQ